jgi:hypothetical protein
MLVEAAGHIDTMGKQEKKRAERESAPLSQRLKGIESGLAAPDQILTATIVRLMAQQFFQQHQTQCER